MFVKIPIARTWSQPCTIVRYETKCLPFLFLSDDRQRLRRTRYRLGDLTIGNLNSDTISTATDTTGAHATSAHANRADVNSARHRKSQRAVFWQLMHACG